MGYQWWENWLSPTYLRPTRIFGLKILVFQHQINQILISTCTKWQMRIEGTRHTQDNIHWWRHPKKLKQKKRAVYEQSQSLLTTKIDMLSSRHFSAILLHSHVLHPSLASDHILLQWKAFSISLPPLLLSAEQTQLPKTSKFFNQKIYVKNNLWCPCCDLGPTGITAIVNGHIVGWAKNQNK